MKSLSTKDLNLYTNHEIDESTHENLMPLLDHLNELRMKIIISVCILLIAIVAGFLLSNKIINLLISAVPQKTLFIQIKPGEFFFTTLKVSVYFGLVTALPVVLWQLTSFIIPGLKKQEKKIIVPVISTTPVLFIIGIIFAFYFLVPATINFLFGFGKGVIPNSIGIENFISFELMLMSICGLAFLLPAACVILAFFNIINSRFLIAQWRYVILSAVIFGAILTPTPDPFNMGIVSGILIILYLASTLIIRLLGK